MIDPRHPDYSNLPGDPRRAAYGYAPGPVNDGPAVSIVTPFHNTPGGIFEQTARSVRGQSLQNFEWIIVNDGSDDPEALGVLERWRNADPRIRVLDIDNVGPGGARNAGYAAAGAGLVFQLDSDDLLEPTVVEKCAWHLAVNPQYGFVSTYEAGFEAHNYLWPHGFTEAHRFLEHCVVGSHAVMVRKSVHAAVGGYDESIRGGMEDWDFWLRCAERGHWGSTIGEFLSWYRRRGSHAARWEDWDGGPRERAFREALKAKYPGVFGGRFPRVQPRFGEAYERIRVEAPIVNPLRKDSRRLLVITPWMTMGGADKFNLDAVRLLASRGWEITVATTLPGDHSWTPEFARHTPDLFALWAFLPAAEHPGFLKYLIETRRPDAVLTTQSEMGYFLLPFLRAHCPGPVYTDYCHMEEEYWKNGGYPRYAVGSQDMLDLSIVSSRHLKEWMVKRGAEAERIEVAYTNRDTEGWKPDPAARERVRAELGVGESTAVILYAGRLCQQKQPAVFAPVIRGLRERGLDCVALVAGSGPDKAYMEQFIRANALSRQVRMLGTVTNDRVRELMSASNIFFLPSLWEGISLAVYEAMSMSLAFVGADVGGQRELVTSECGVLIQRGSPEEEIERYTDELARLISDLPACRAMGEAARRRICTEFELDLLGDRLIELFERAESLRASEPRGAPTPAFGTELASRAVEYIRIHGALESLWQERERFRAAPAAPACAAATQEIELIERSRFWRLLQGFKHNPVYRAVAETKYGPGWDEAPAGESPEARLARIKSSRAYRVIRAVRGTGSYQWYTKRRHAGGNGNGTV